MRHLIALALLLAAARPCSAQNSSKPDFLFGQPRGGVAIRTGWMMARAGSDLFSFVQEQLTVDRKDFNAPQLGMDLDISISPRASAVAGFDFSSSTTNSEYRNLVDNDRLPIQQSTQLRQLNLTGGVKFALAPRGREISQHAWIPAPVTPYVGAGAGLVHYNFSQQGDFVDFTDSSVFPHTYGSKGWAPSAHLFGGVDVKAWKRVYLNGEARYRWAHADLGADFSGFEPIDLAGFNVTAGLRCIF